jgi:uncharacterized membrane protein
MGSFFKTLGRKFVAGFLILLPFLLAYLLVGGFVDLVVLLTQPLEDVLPHLGLMSPTARHVAVLALLFSIFVLVGILKDTKPAQRLGAWIEREFFFKFPPYRLVRDITRRLAGEDIPSMHPALLELTPGIRTVGFIVEELDENLVTVFQPLTSLPTMGTLHIVSEAKVERLDAKFMDAIGWYFNWGADTHAVLSGRTAEASPARDGQ